jgi:hypothetical protein
MPGCGAWLAEKLQTVSPSAVSTYLLLYLPHGVITVNNNLSVIRNLRGSSLITVFSDEVFSDRGKLGEEVLSLQTGRYGFGTL